MVGLDLAEKLAHDALLAEALQNERKRMRERESARFSQIGKGKNEEKHLTHDKTVKKIGVENT